MLHVASVCTPCCILLHTTANTNATTPNNVGSCCFRLHVALKKRNNREVENVACANSRHFAMPSVVSPRNEVWETTAEIPYLWRVTSHIWVVLLIGWKSASSNQKHYPDLGSETSSVWNFCVRSSDVIWLVGNLLHPIRSTIQIWVVTRHQYGIFAFVPQTSFREETTDGVAKCRLFSQAVENRQL